MIRKQDWWLVTYVMQVQRKYDAKANMRTYCLDSPCFDGRPDADVFVFVSPSRPETGLGTSASNAEGSRLLRN